MGTVTISGFENDDQAGDVTVTVTATAETASGLDAIAPRPVSLMIVDDETTPVVTLSLSTEEIVEENGRTFVTATLDNRSNVETIVTVSASPRGAAIVYRKNLIIPAGQTTSIGRGAEIHSLDDNVLTDSRKMVTVNGEAANSQGVTAPNSVTLTIIDDEAPYFSDDDIVYTFTEGLTASRLLPEAAHGDGPLTYSLTLDPKNGVTFSPGPPSRIGIPSTSIAGETTYTLIATDVDGDTDTMPVRIKVVDGVCANSTAVLGHTSQRLVSDCEALLAAKDILRGSRTLNWTIHRSIYKWQGISFDTIG